MTYCLAMKVKGGIVGIADTLITSGREMTTLRKVEIYSPPHGTMFVMTSGLRSLRDKMLTYFENARAGYWKAIGAFRKAVEIKPDYAVAHKELALALLQIGDRAGAKDNLSTYVELVPNAPDAPSMQALINSLK